VEKTRLALYFNTSRIRKDCMHIIEVHLKCNELHRKGSRVVIMYCLALKGDL
jgi:hypothetical protein